MAAPHQEDDQEAGSSTGPQKNDATQREPVAPGANATGSAISGHPSRLRPSYVANIEALRSRVPHVLRMWPGWALWRYELDKRGKDWTKVPKIADARGELRNARSNCSAPACVEQRKLTGARCQHAQDTWRTWYTAMEALQARTGRGEQLGIGFFFSEDDPYTAIDLDHIDPDQAQTIIDSFASYAEISPSGQGIRIIIDAEKPADSRKKLGDIECYDRARFMTITGNQITGTPATIEERQAELQAFIITHLTPAKAERAARTNPSSSTNAIGEHDLSDQQIIERAMRAKDGAKFTDLWNGGNADRPSASEADLSLCCILRFWAGNDAGRIDRLFRQSPRFADRADKWDDRRGEQTYGEQTIATALEIGGETYTPKPPKGAKSGRGKKSDGGKGNVTPIRQRDQAGTGGEDLGEEDGEDGEEGLGGLTGGAVTKRVAEEIAALGERFAVDYGRTLWVYRDGAYVRRGEQVVRRHVKAILASDDGLAIPEKWTRRQADEVIEFITVDASLLWEEPPLHQINLRNGIFNTDTGQLEPHSPDFLSPVQLPITYDPDATCPAIETFFGQVFPADTLALAWEIAAWLITPDISFQKAVLALGPGGNGKSRWLRLMQAMLGAQNVSAVPLQKLEADRFSVARLIGKMANICADLPATPMEGTSTFKSITGGDPMLAEQKYKESFEFTPFSRLLFSANNPPRSPDASPAFYDRWIAIPFVGRFRGEANEIDSDTLDKRLAAPSELSGLLNRALAVLPKLRRTHRFSESDSTRRAMADFRSITDPFTIWLDDNTVTAPEAMVSKDDLFQAFMDHCTKNGLPRITKVAFGIQLKHARAAVREAQRTWKGKVTWCWIGIGLVSRQPSDQRGRRHDVHGVNGLNGVSPIVDSIAYQSQPREDEEADAWGQDEETTGETQDSKDNNREKSVKSVKSVNHTDVAEEAADAGGNSTDDVTFTFTDVSRSYNTVHNAIAQNDRGGCVHLAHARVTLPSGRTICGQCGTEMPEVED